MSRKEKIMIRRISLVFSIFFLVSIIGVTASALTLTPIEQLGKSIFFDKISNPSSLSCSKCHSPDVGWTGPIGGINRHGAVYRGAVPQRFGNRKPPSAAYATLSPIFYYDEEEGLFVGGNFWDGRATGEHLGNPAADQALGPFLNPVEQNNPSKKSVCEKVAKAKYAWLWKEAWNEPIRCDTDDEVDKNYDRIGLAIAEYENSSEVNQFSSKYDYYLAGMVDLSPQEESGMNLFNEKGGCSSCHPSEGLSGESPLFTDFTYDNLGIPKNPENPFYKMDKVYLDDGSPINPLGAEWVDKGLGGMLETHSNLDWQAMAGENMGKHKVPTLRNVDKRKGKNFPKAYGHNGYFKSLKGIVHFYNTRDVIEECKNPLTTEKRALAMDCWPQPEISDTVNTEELGNLGLTDGEEDAIVAFLQTLSDGYIPKKLNKKAIGQINSKKKK
jgi:cytochrome c peroxidase